MVQSLRPASYSDPDFAIRREETLQTQAGNGSVSSNRFVSFQVCRLYSALAVAGTAGTSTVASLIYKAGTAILGTAILGTSTAGSAVINTFGTFTLAAQTQFTITNGVDATSVAGVTLEYDHDPSNTTANYN
jgi:hypothetical protein